MTIEQSPGRSATELADRYQEVRAHTETLASVLRAEDQVVQSMPDASPTKWHRAHVTWFFETFLLKPFHPTYVELDEVYGFLFNSYYEAVGPRHTRAQRGLITRPTVDEVAEYRRHVDAAMLELLIEPVAQEVAELVVLGFHHEQQHQELLLMDIKHLFSLNPMGPAYYSDASQRKTRRLSDGSNSRAGSRASVTKAPNSASTTRAHTTRSFCNRSNSPIDW